MISLDEFRTGQLSIPSLDEDDLPPCCFACVYLSYKEFSAHYGDGLFYYCCAYSWPERINQTVPACMADSAAKLNRGANGGNLEPIK